MPRWSFRRVPTFIAFAILASISFVAVFLSSRENPSFVQLQRRHEHVIVARQSDAAASSQNSSSFVSRTASRTTTGSSTSGPILSTPSVILGSSSQPKFGPAATRSLGSQIISQSTGQSESIMSTSSVPFFPQSPSTTSVSLPVPMTDSRTQPPSPTVQPDSSTTLFSTTTTDIFPTSAITFGVDPSTTPSQNAIAATAGSGNFWRNKPAVAGTFVVFTLIILGAVAGVTFSYYKKRNARMHDRLHDQLFDEPEGTRNSSPGLSVNAAPMDPFATREIHHVSLFPESHTRVPYEPSQEIGFYASPTSLNSGAPTKAALRSHVGRKSYQTSIDSFYGASKLSG